MGYNSKVLVHLQLMRLAFKASLLLGKEKEILKIQISRLLFDHISFEYTT